LHCNPRWVLQNPHEYKGFLRKLFRSHSLMRYAFRGGNPGKTGSPEG
jgi:hypothetical protein